MSRRKTLRQKDKERRIFVNLGLPWAVSLSLSLLLLFTDGMRRPCESHIRIVFPAVTMKGISGVRSSSCLPKSRMSRGPTRLRSNSSRSIGKQSAMTAYTHVIHRSYGDNGLPAAGFVSAGSRSPAPLLTKRSKRRIRALHSATTTPHDNDNSNDEPSESVSTTKKDVRPRRVAIIGGGLAGLSVAYQLLEKTTAAAAATATGSSRSSESSKSVSSLQVTIFDKCNVGEGGASSVAGGLLHPFSPRGKLVHMGLQGLRVTDHLVGIASRYQPRCILRNRLFRPALTAAHAERLQQTAAGFPQYGIWHEKNAEFLRRACGGTMGADRSPAGALELTNGCRVIHVPSYLRGLWEACRDVSNGTAQWKRIDDNPLSGSVSEQQEKQWKDRLNDGFDTVILAAGAGLFQDSSFLDLLQRDEEMKDWPVQLVRGQSIDMILPEKLGSVSPSSSLSSSATITTTTTEGEKTSSSYGTEAVLCGKYITPTLEEGRMLIGATHEFKKEALSKEEVVAELKSRSYDLAPEVWDHGTVDTITSGWRVQSQRGKYGRMPIIGRVGSIGSISGSSNLNIHHDVWLFTGLGSRGLIYHGIYGDILSDAILDGNEDGMLSEYPELSWWRRKGKLKQ